MTPVFLMIALLWCDRVFACEPLPCQRSYVLPAGGVIPSNAPGIRWFINPPDELVPKNIESMIQLFVVEKGDQKKVPTVIKQGEGVRRWLVYDVRPKAGWAPDKLYRGIFSSPCPIGPSELKVDLKVKPQAGLPKKLGRLVAGQAQQGPLRVGTAGGMCRMETDAVYHDIGVEPDPSALPWASVLEYETYVDEQRWYASRDIGYSPPPGSSWVGQGRDRIYALCGQGEGLPGVTEGEHKVFMRARIGASSWLATPPIRITLRCKEKSTVSLAKKTDEAPDDSRPWCRRMKGILTGSPSPTSQVAQTVTIPEKQANAGEWQGELWKMGNALGFSKDGQYQATLQWKINGGCDSAVTVLIQKEKKEIERILLYDGYNICERKADQEKEDSLINERVRKTNNLFIKYGLMTPEWVVSCNRSPDCPLNDGRLISVDQDKGELVLENPKTKSREILKEVKPEIAVNPLAEGSTIPEEKFFPFCPWVGGVAQSGNRLAIQINYMSFGPDGFGKDSEVWTIKLKSP